MLIENEKKENRAKKTTPHHKIKNNVKKLSGRFTKFYSNPIEVKSTVIPDKTELHER